MKRHDVSLGTTETLGASLERERLQLRARHVSAVIAALRQLAGGERAGNRHIRQTIAE